jgi:CBS domain-containing protein
MAARSLLEKSNLGSLAHHQHVVTIKGSDTLEDAFRTLVMHKITAAPVQDPETHEFLGYLEMVSGLCVIA